MANWQPVFIRANEIGRCPRCSLPVFPYDEFCPYCNHQLKNPHVKVMGRGVGSGAIDDHAGNRVSASAPPLTERKGGIEMGLKMKVEAPRPVVEDGAHRGTITKIETREGVKKGRKFTYADVYVLEEETGAELKVGYPANVSEKSMLGELLQRFGVVLEVGKEVDIEAALVNRKCQFVTVSKATDAWTFANITRESLKPTA